ncbi:MAG: MOSC domain-containing protein [Candidatus Nanopelagicales bacterium]
MTGSTWSSMMPAPSSPSGNYPNWRWSRRNWASHWSCERHWARPQPSRARSVDIEVWGYEGRAADCGDEVAELLSAFLGRSCRLVMAGPALGRRSDDGASGIAFADGYPLLLIGEASLAALNERLEQPLPMNRFRPNIVVAGSGPFEEDEWLHVELGTVGADVVKPCLRCAITRVDQATGVRGDGEPLRTLGQFRKVKGGVQFGQNLVHTGTGTLSVGDPVSVRERRS